MGNQFVLRRGLSKVFAAEVLTDEEGGITFGEPFHLIPAGEMTRTTSSESANVWYDNTVFDSAGSEGATEVSITGASLRPADIAKLTGKTVDDATGAIVDDGDFHPKFFAVGGEAKRTDGTAELFWFLKGTFTAPEESDKTEDESTDTNGMTLTYSAVKTKHIFNSTGKACKRVTIDTETTELVADASWNAQVVTPDNLSTVCKKKNA